jgi:hypothetical protein
MTICTTLSAAVLSGLVLGVGAQGLPDSRPLVGAYLQIQELLAADKIDGIAEPARAIVQQAAAMGEQGVALADAAKAVEAARDLKTAREAFGTLSDAVITATKGQDLGDVKLAFCPMVSRSWLQRDPRIRNPYYGSGMLECGEFRDPKK